MTVPPLKQREQSIHWASKAYIADTASTFEASTSGAYDSVTSEDHFDSQEVEGFLDNDATSIMTNEEDNQWSKLNILSLDGGGVRGYCSLLIIGELMRHVAEKERPHSSSSMSSPLFDLEDNEISDYSEKPARDSRYFPCDYFDYIGGTSTGGLIALMLGRLRFNVDEALRQYRTLAERVLEKPKSRLKRSLTRYSSESRKKELGREFANLQPHRRSAGEEIHALRSDPARCKTIVCAVKSNPSKSLQTPALFRSYEVPRGSLKYGSSNNQWFDRGSADRAFTIGEVATATSAAPSYYKPMDLGDVQYFDAGMYLNNPSWEILNEISVAVPSSQTRVDLLLSIGGGSASGNAPQKRSRSPSVRKTLTETFSIVETKVRQASSRGKFSYFRLNVEEGLHDVQMNEWKPRDGGHETLRRIERATRNYLCHKDVQERIKECAAVLVATRKQRAHTMLWERFATGTRYKCPKKDCVTPQKLYQHRNALLDHLRAEHKIAPPDASHFAEVEELLNIGRTRPGETLAKRES